MVRLQNIILLFVLILVTTSANAQNAGDKIQIGDFWYKIIDDENKKVELCDTVEGASFGGNISIPSTVQYNEQSYNVTKIGADAFKKGYYSKFSIPSSISEISANAFAGCVIDSVKYASTDHMQEIAYGTGTSNPMAISKKVFVEDQEHELQNIELTISQDVKPRVFKGAKWLTGVTFTGNGVETIGDDAFYGTMIESIILPPTLTSVGSGVFKNCSNLQTVNIKAPLPTLSDQMFLNCSNLTSVTLNAATTATGKSTFYGCSSLTSLPQELKTIGEKAFGKCTGFITLEIPATITSIGNNAFEGCNKIEDIVIVERDQNNPLSIGSEAFKDLSHLKYIYSHAMQAPTAQSNSFEGGVVNKKNIELYYPLYATGYYEDNDENADLWKSFSQKKFGEPYYKLTYIWGDGGNERGETDKNIVVGSKIIDQIPEGKRVPTKSGWGSSVGWKDGEGNDITANSGMPPQDLTIYAYFKKEESGSQYIYDLLYSPDKSTAKIKGLNASITSIEIKDDDNNKVNIGGVDYQIISIEANAFKGQQSLVAVDLSKATNLTSIGNGIFEGCTNLVSVDLGNKLTTIPNRAFYGCSKLASFTLPSTIETIGADAFNQCNSLTELPWGASNLHLQTIKANAFKFCNNLTAIALPPSFQRLEDNAFFGCSNIRMITINSQVPEVDGTPFSFQNFKDVYLYVNPEWKDAYNAEDCYWNLFTINPTAKTLTYIIDGNQEQPYDQIESVIPGTKISPHASPVEPFKGWYGEPEIMPNEDVVVNGWLQYKVTYMAEGTNDKLINEPSVYFTGDEITTPDNLLKKNGLTYVIVNPIATMPAQDVTIFVKYSLNNAPTGRSNLLYNGDNQSLLNNSSSPTGTTLKYSLDNVNFSTTIPQGKDVKTYVVYYRVEGITPNYKTESKSLSVAIAPREITTFSISPTSYIYDGSEKKPAVTVTYNNTTVPSNEYTVSYTNNINVGTATVTLSDKNGGNYNIHGNKTFTITKADGSMKQNPSGIANLTYNGKAQNLITIGSSETGTVEYSMDKTNYSTTIPTGIDAKSYTVYYRVKGDANHKDANGGSVNVAIAKAPLTITAENQEIFEGEDIPEFSISYDGFMNNETQTVLTNNPTVSCRANATSKAGEYTITVGGAKADNYNITHKNGKLVILALKFVSGGGTTKDEDDAATYQITSIGNDKGATPTVSITDDKEVGGAFAIPETVTYHNKTFTVTEISESAFENNKYLTEVTIPSSITNIGDKAFKGCSNLKSITVYITTPISLAVAGTRGGTTRVVSTSVFDGVDKTTCILYVPEASVNLYKTAPVWKEFQHILPLSSNPTGISGVTKTEDEPFDIYNLQGQKVKSKATSLDGLTRGIYIINGKKIVVK